jgi:hypothetical protein
MALQSYLFDSLNGLDLPPIYHTVQRLHNLREMIIWGLRNLPPLRGDFRNIVGLALTLISMGVVGPLPHFPLSPGGWPLAYD